MNLKRGTGFDGHERGGDPGLDEPARAATLRLIERHGAQVMRTARRYSVTAEDAEDAYQRAVEIMLTKAPDIPDAELLPWLKTVVKHEAFAIRRQQSCSALGVDGSLDGAGGAEASIAARAPCPMEQTERFERLRLGAEAMRHLKPQEIRAMTLLARTTPTGRSARRRDGPTPRSTALFRQHGLEGQRPVPPARLRACVAA
jgi:DNA-directed RNA polymerase specialized sigma24 family protein